VTEQIFSFWLLLKRGITKLVLPNQQVKLSISNNLTNYIIVYCLPINHCKERIFTNTKQ